MVDWSASCGAGRRDVSRAKACTSAAARSASSARRSAPTSRPSRLPPDRSPPAVSATQLSVPSRAGGGAANCTARLPAAGPGSCRGFGRLAPQIELTRSACAAEPAALSLHAPNAEPSGAAAAAAACTCEEARAFTRSARGIRKRCCCCLRARLRDEAERSSEAARPRPLLAEGGASRAASPRVAARMPDETFSRAGRLARLGGGDSAGAGDCKASESAEAEASAAAGMDVGR